jgi:hypothetical protein
VDYDTLVIQLTCISDESTAFYWDLVGRDAPVVFKQVEFSLNQLIAFGEIFVEAIDAPLVSFGFDTMANSFRITLDKNCDSSMQVEESFGMTARFMPIPLIIALCEPAFDMALIGGTQISGNGRSFSVGITGRSRIIPGNALLTTGHAFHYTETGTPVRRGTQEIGRLQVFRDGRHFAGDTGTIHGDWAVVNLNASGSSMMTNMLRSGDRINSWRGSSAAPVGTVVMGTGAMTLRWSGQVRDVNIEVINSNNHRRTGITRVAPIGNTAPTNGDSGGPIWSTSTSLTMFEGVLSAGSPIFWYYSPLMWASAHFTPISQ